MGTRDRLRFGEAGVNFLRNRRPRAAIRHPIVSLSVLGGLVHPQRTGQIIGVARIPAIR